jgi:hypothetical protein
MLALAFCGGVVWYVRLATPAEDSARTFDLREYFFPTYAAFYGRLARGEWLRWNPYQLCGLPWLGTVQAGFFYPPHVLYLVLPTHQGLFCSTLLHVLLGICGTAAFARRIGLGWSAAAVAGLAFGLRGSFANWTAWPYMLEATAWLPVGCLAVYDLASRPTARRVALFGATLGMSWLAGGPQATVFSLYAWGTLFAVLLVTSRHGCRSAGVLAFVGALGIGTFAGLVQLLPARELASVGARQASALDTASMFPVGILHLTVRELAAPGGLAGLTRLGLVLAPLAVFARAQRRIVAWAVLLAALVLSVALGPDSPTFELYRLLPLLTWFRSPPRLLVLTAFGAALLTGIGADVFVRWLRSRGAPRRARLVVDAALVGLALLEVPALPGRVPYTAKEAARYHDLDRLFDTLAAHQGSWRAVALGATARLATIHGVRTVPDYEPLATARQEAFVRYAFERPLHAVPAGSHATGPDFAAVAASVRLLAVASTRLVAVPDFAAGAIEPALRAAGLREAAIDVPDWTVLENPRAVPRAFVTYRTRTAPEDADAALAALSAPTFDPLAASDVDGPAPLADVPAAPAGHPATLLVDRPHVVEIEATLAEQGLVVLADTLAPGWDATVDGATAPIRPTNFLFRGVVVPAGTHRIRFVYRSRAVDLGALGSVIGWSALALLGLRLPRR